MTYSELVRTIERFEDEKLKSSGQKFKDISVALEAMMIVKGAFDAKTA